MLQVLERFYASACGIKKKEEFETMNPSMGGWSGLPLILALATLLILQLVVGKWLWNNYLVKAITVVNPLKSAIDVLALSLLAKLMLG